MPVRVRVYIAAVVAVGIAGILRAVAGWHSPNYLGFCVYLCLSVFASGFKLRLPGVTGTMSAGFLLTLTGIVCLTLPEALMGACAAVLIQCVWHAQSRQWVKIAFNIASVATAVTCSGALFDSQWLHDLHLEFAVRLAILGCVYFIANTLPVAGAIALTEGKSIRFVWQASFFWSLLHYVVASAIAGLFYITREHLGWQTAFLLVPVTGLIYRACSLHLGRVEDAKTHAEETAALHLRTVTSLALAIEAKDQDTHDHLRRVQVYAVEIGKQMGLSANDLEALRAAALLHDIGKIAVPDHILSKPGKLTPQEFLRMKVHPVVGAEILERARFPFPVAPIVRCHHEKWDGSGYPAGLKGEQIPLGARILSAVDCLDALASHRQYRRALPLDAAIAVVTQESGKSFDPRVVAILLSRYRELEQMARANPPESQRLRTDICVERGAAPGAGFAESDPTGEKVATPAAEITELVRLGALLDSVNSDDPVLTFHEALSVLTARLSRLIPFESLGIYVRNGDTLETVYASGSHCGTLASLAIPMGQGVTGWAAELKQPIINANPEVEWHHSEAEFRGDVPASALALPLACDSVTAGVLTLYASAENAFSQEHLQILAGLEVQLGRYLRRNAVLVRPDSGAPDVLKGSLKLTPPTKHVAPLSPLVH